MGNSEMMKEKGYFGLFGEVYKLLSGGFGDDWPGIVGNADKICEKYVGTALEPLSQTLVRAVVDELEREK